MPDSTNKTVQEQFGGRLKQLREEKKLSKTALADILGMERISLTNIEKGKRNVTLKTLTALANALEVPIALLLDFNGQLSGSAKQGTKRAASKKQASKKKTTKTKRK